MHSLLGFSKNNHSGNKARIFRYRDEVIGSGSIGVNRNISHPRTSIRIKGDRPPRSDRQSRFFGGQVYYCIVLAREQTRRWRRTDDLKQIVSCWGWAGERYAPNGIGIHRSNLSIAKVVFYHLHLRGEIIFTRAYNPRHSYSADNSEDQKHGDHLDHGEPVPVFYASYGSLHARTP